MIDESKIPHPVAEMDAEIRQLREVCEDQEAVIRDQREKIVLLGGRIEKLSAWLVLERTKQELVFLECWNEEERKVAYLKAIEGLKAEGKL